MGLDLSKVKKRKPRVDKIAILKVNVSIKQVVDELGIVSRYGLKKMGTSLKGNCPTGHPSASGTCFSIDVPDNLFHCYHCHEAGDIIQLVQLVQGIDTKGAINWLARKFDPKLLTNGTTAVEEEEVVHDPVHLQHQDLFKLIYEHGKDQLLNAPEAQIVRDYLSNDRGYDLSLLKDTEFIYWADEMEIQRYLREVAPDQRAEIMGLSLNGAHGDLFRLAIPYRDMHGAITGFMKRAHEPKGVVTRDGTLARWDSTKGLTKPDAFGMHRIHDQGTLLIVEGYPDATYLPTAGIANVVALGQASWSDKYFGAFETRGVKRIILALDNDGGTGIANTEDICSRFIGHEIQVFVIDPPLMGASKDPDEYVKANGAGALKQLMGKAESSAKWLLRLILSQHNLTTDIGRDVALDEVFELETKFSDPFATKEIIDHLSQALSIPIELLDAKVRTQHERLAKRKAAEEFAELAADVQATIADGNTAEAIGLLSRESKSIAFQLDSSVKGAQQPLLDLLMEKEAREAQRAPGSILGYPLSKFRTISKYLCGLQSGLYIVAADPNIGKTAFLLNMLLDAVDSNPGVSAVFYSMDDTRMTIINRLLAILSQIDINAVQSKQSDPQDATILKDAYEELRRLIADKRLDIKDALDVTSMDAIELDLLSRDNQDKLIVAIDGLFNVGVEGEQGSIRETNIERANGLKGLTQRFKMPLLATAEIRKTMSGTKKAERTIQDIMETGKFGYNADVVWIMQTADPDKAKEDPVIDVKLKFDKNKLSSFKSLMNLKFYKSKSTFTE